MKGTKRILSSALALAAACVLSAPLCAPVVSELAAYAEEIAVVTSGTYENLSWSVDNGVLTISGEGDMAVPSGTGENMPAQSASYPWNEFQYTSLVIAEGVTSISDSAFAALRMTADSTSSVLETVSFPSTLKSIGRNAFCGAALISVSIPGSVESLGDNAFALCWKLKEVDFKASVTTIPAGCFYETSIHAFTIPEYVTAIGEKCFFRCVNIKEIELHEGITSIGDQAFSYTAIESIHIPESLTELTAFAMRCAELREITIPSHITVIPDSFVSGCTSLRDVSGIIRDGITSIGKYAFNETAITEITVPESVEFIGNYAFSQCQFLEYAEIRANITELPERCFDNCTALKTCTLPDTLELISTGAFYRCAITEITLPEGLIEIEASAFETASPMTEVIIPDSVKTIAGDSFPSVISLTLGANTAFAKRSAKLYECERIDEIYVHPDNPYYEAEDGILYNKGKTEILDFAATHVFENDTYYIPDTVLEISEPVYSKNIMSFAVSAENTRFSTVDGILTDKNGKTLVSYPYGREHNVYKIPDGIKVIGEKAFYRNSTEHIILPDSVETISECAFGDSSLVRIEMGSGLKLIDSDAFLNCNIKYVELQSMTGTVQANAFGDSLEVLRLPADSGMLCSEIFAPNARVISGDEASGETIASGTHGAFAWEIKNGVLIITGSGAMESCAYTEYPWYGLEFYCVKFIGENIAIPDSAFCNAERLCLLELDGVVSVGTKAFYNCSALVSVTGDEAVTYAGDSAFDGADWREYSAHHYRTAESEGACILGSVLVFCEADAETIRIPDTVTYAMKNAFDECVSAKTLYISRDGFDCTDVALKDSINIEHLRFNGSDTDITLTELQEMGKSCETVSITDSAGNTSTGRVIYSQDRILCLIDKLIGTPYVQNLSIEYCREAISEMDVNADMTDEELICAFFDYLIENTNYSFTYIEDAKGIYTGENTVWSLSKLYSHDSEGLAILESGVCSSYSGMFMDYAAVLAEQGISNTISALENFGVGHQWNIIGLDTGTAYERWYYLDASNGQCLIGYESDILRNNAAMFSYDPALPKNEDGTYTITLSDGKQIRLQAEAADGTAVERIKGDADGNGAIEVADASLVLSIYAQQAAGLDPDVTEETAAAADVDGDGAIEVSDAAVILTYYARYSAGLEPVWEEIIGAS